MLSIGGRQVNCRTDYLTLTNEVNNHDANNDSAEIVDIDSLRLVALGRDRMPKRHGPDR